MQRRVSVRMAAGLLGSNGATPTCRGSGANYGSANVPPMARSAISASSPAERTSRSSNPNGRQTAGFISSPIAHSPRSKGDGGTCFVSAATRWTDLPRSSRLPARGGIRQSAVGVPAVHLRIRLGEPTGVQLCAGRGSPDEHCRPRLARTPSHYNRIRGHLLCPRDSGPGLLRRRLADHANSRRRAAPAVRAGKDLEALDHSGCRGLPQVLIRAGAGDVRHRQRAAGARLVLPPAKRRFRRPRRRGSAAARALPRRTDRGRVPDPQLGDAILDQPRLRRFRRQLRRQHGVWPRVPASVAGELGSSRCRRLRKRRALPCRNGTGRPGTLGDQRRQRGRLHDIGGVDVPQGIQDRRELLRCQRFGGPGKRYAQIRVRAISTA